MKISKFRTKSYKSFSNTDTIEFLEKINIIIGHNDSGKSALLYCIKHPTDRNPHIDGIHELPGDRFPTETKLSVTMSLQELFDDHKRHRISEFVFPIPEVIIDKDGQIYEPEYSRVEEIIRSTSHLEFTLEYRDGAIQLSDDLVFSGWRFIFSDKIRTAFKFSIQNSSIEGSTTFSEHAFMANAFQGTVSRNVFYFQPERLNIATYPSSFTNRLESSAQNLPAFIDTLIGTRHDQFDMILHHIRSIIPTVGNVSTRSDPSIPQNRQILVWPTTSISNPEFAFPLNQCGTGVAQVLAILSVIATAPPSIILIDEINNFLHPASIKELLRIIRTNYDHHQYIISGHSPELIAESYPSTMHLIRRDGYESTVIQMKVNDYNSYAEIADHLGISISDALVANRVVWVEGPTEQICLPFIADHVKISIPQGLAFIPVVNTGDLTGKTKRKLVELAAELYTRMMEFGLIDDGKAVFTFDMEDLNDKQKYDLAKLYRGRIVFLPRRNIECYMLDPSAIAQCLNILDIGRRKDYVVQDIYDAYTDVSGHYGAGLEFDKLADADEYQKIGAIDGAKIVGEIFGKLTEGRIRYDKKRHGIEILKLRAGFSEVEKAELIGFLSEAFKKIAIE